MKWGGLTLLTLVLAGVIYQQAGSIVDGYTVTIPGQMVEVNGHRVHIVCQGSGASSLVLDAGLGAAAFEWHRLQPQLAKNARVCAFDRPGQGTSDAIAHAYDGATAADELHMLVRAAQIATPFVYVGHSLGANFAEIYAARYPHDLSALVLIEPGMPKDILADFHGTRAEALAMPATCGTLCVAGWVAGELGVARLVVNYVHTGASSFDGDKPALEQYRAIAARSSMAGASAAYFAALPKIMYQVVDIKSFGSLPVLILASSIAPPPDAGETAADMVTWRKRQLAHFATMAAMSAVGVGPLTIANSTHASMVMGDRSLETARAIAGFLALVLRNGPGAVQQHR